MINPFEMMKEYHTHLYTFKDDEVLAKATTQEMKLLLERASNGMQKLANQQNLEIQQLIFWLETGLVHHNEYKVKSSTQIAVELWNKFAAQVDCSNLQQINNMVCRLKLFWS